MPFISPARFDARSFSVFQRSMMQDDPLPLVDAIDEECFAQAFEEHEVDFGADEEDVVYTPAITLWALISQVFYAKEMRSCQAAVGRVASLWASLGRRVCATDTGAYCRARLKIPFDVVRTITRRLAAEGEWSLEGDTRIAQQDPELNLAPAVIAAVKQESAGGRILLVDGFTTTASDTPENQAEYPQNPAQAEGLGFPILRCLSLVSMFTGLLVVSHPFQHRLRT